MNSLGDTFTRWNLGYLETMPPILVLLDGRALLTTLKSSLEYHMTVT